MNDYLCDSVVWTILSKSADGLRECSVPENIINSICETSYEEIVGFKPKKGDFKAKTVKETKKKEMTSNTLTNIIESRKNNTWFTLDDGKKVLTSYQFGDGMYPIAESDNSIFGAISESTGDIRPLHNIETVVLKNNGLSLKDF